MKKIIVILFSITLLFFSISYTSAHVKHYNNLKSLEYELFLNDKLIGSHIFFFNLKGDSLEVKSEGNFKVNKMGIQLMNYHTKSSAVYINGKLNSFESETLQNDKKKYVKLKLNESNFFEINGSSFKGEINIRNSIIGSWWNHEIVNKKKQISIISGSIIDQNVKFLGKEKILIKNKEFNALHFHFLSNDDKPLNKKKINMHVWYDSDTLLWIKSSYDKLGKWEYRLKKAKF